MIKRAILHVENTDRLVDFAKYLSLSGWTILSANKTEEYLRNNKIPVQQEPALVENNYYTNESYRLIEKILLTKYDQPDYLEVQQHEEDNNIFILCLNITPVVNVNILSRSQANPVRPVNMYISTLLKNAFVNYENVLILTDPDDYDEAIIQLKTNNITKDFRTYLAAKALNLSSAYDGGIAASVLRNEKYNVSFMNYLALPFKKDSLLLQGANSHQTACVYKSPTSNGLIDNFLRLPIDSLTYNLAADVAFAWEQISTLFSILKNQFTIKSTTCDGYPFTTQFTPLTGTVFTMAVKVNSIVGAALSTNVLDSLKKTYTYDTKNISDAVFASSAVIDEDAANEIINCNFAAIVAPGYTHKAKNILKAKDNIELISASKPNNILYDGKLVNGGLIIQQKDNNLFDHWVIKTKRRPTQFQTDEMALGMLLVMGARSFSAVLIKDNAVVGISEACPSRVQAIDEVYSNTKKHNRLNNLNTKKEAVKDEKKEGEKVNNTDCNQYMKTPAGVLSSSAFCMTKDNSIADILVSDTYIPFCDSVKKIIDEGVTAIIHTGRGSIDKEFIDYCDEKGVTMVFTEMSHIKF